jgi:hypothetical protein
MKQNQIRIFFEKHLLISIAAQAVHGKNCLSNQKLTFGISGTNKH